jgi:allophanate hydrolase subunit 2
MTEDPIAGGYEIAAVVHSDDLRLVAQTPGGQRLAFQEMDPD